MAVRAGGVRCDRPDGRVILPVGGPYDLRRTLQCGQTFRWRIAATGATGVFAGRRVHLQVTAGGIAVDGLDNERDLLRFRHCLGLDEPLAAIEAELIQDRVLRRILPHTSGIAIMRQDPWECLVSFVVSAFNNIPKIELSLDRLARRFGRGIATAAWAFPPPRRLAAARVSELRRCALGYRAPYVQAVARQIASGQVDLDALGHLAAKQARGILLTLPGVGEKVADCVLLFAYGKGEVFPVDVWVKRAVEQWYFHGQRQTERQIQEFARRRFGPLAGYAQQHLFYFSRTAASRRRQPTKPPPQSGRHHRP